MIPISRTLSFRQRTRLLTLLFSTSVLLFLIALPLNALSGAGRGFLANPTPFPGLAIVLFSILLPFSGSLGGLAWLLIALANVFVFVAPASTLARKHSPFFLSYAVVAIAAVPVLFVLWPEGYFIGAWVWAASILLAATGTLLCVLRAR